MLVYDWVVAHSCWPFAHGFAQPCPRKSGSFCANPAAGSGCRNPSLCRRHPGISPGLSSLVGGADAPCFTAGLRSTTAVLLRATAAPWRASASRRRPPLRGRCLGWRAEPLSRGCGGLAAGCRWLAGVRSQLSSRGCAGTGRFGADLMALILSEPRPPRVDFICADPLPCNRTPRLSVSLY
jgi:hypothetical protein